MERLYDRLLAVWCYEIRGYPVWGWITAILILGIIIGGVVGDVLGYDIIGEPRCGKNGADFCPDP